MGNAMDINKLWAKSSGETIEEHTNKLLDAFNEFKTLYGKCFDEITLKTVEYACKYHDLGKCAFVFQKMLGNKAYTNSIPNKKELEKMYSEMGFEKNVPHGNLSPAFISNKEMKAELGQEMTQYLYNAIFFHHNRNRSITPSELDMIYDYELKPLYNAKSKKYMSKLFNSEIEECNWVKYAVILGLLNKFDYYASDTKEKSDVEINGNYNGKYIGDYVYEAITRHYKLRDVQQYALEKHNENIIIIASTGIGKTEAALLWAGNRKLFYTLPLKVSINAMYRRIKDKYGYSGDKVTLLHSDALNELIENNEENDTNIIENAMIKYHASKLLSYPVTVCTIDQLFSFVYKYRGCELILASLKYSVVIIDEIQSYEPEIIAKLIYGLYIITLAGGKFAIITATLPPVLTYFIDKKGVYNIPHAAPAQFLRNDITRHKIHISEADDFDYDEILKYGKTKKVLVICNTVKRAVEVFKMLNSDGRFENIRLLHSKFIKKHRKMLEDEIIRFAESENETGIWISTQIVEASLDIDFDLLFTEMCTADSLLQRMGRCYRNRDYKDDSPNIYIVNNKNGYGTVYKYKEIFDRSFDYLLQFNNQLFTEKDKMQYINQVYDTEELKNSNSSYFNEIKNEINRRMHTPPFEFSKENAKQKFRNIVSYMVIPESIYNKNNSEFERCRDVLKNKSKYSFNEINSAKMFIENHSIGLGNFDPRVHERCNSFFEKLEYFTLDYKYNFDEELLCGIGLDYDKDEDSNFL